MKFSIIKLFAILLNENSLKYNLAFLIKNFN